jgi:glycosyltransferase involved in cell wall biosynthesis
LLIELYGKNKLNPPINYIVTTNSQLILISIILKILIISQYFYPENFKINDIVFYLKEHGYDVEVLTSKPNYPKGKFYKGYNFFNKNIEFVKGIKTYRVPTIPRLKGGPFGMILNYFSFVFFSYFILLFKKFDKYDLILGNQLSPIFSMMPAIWMKRKQDTPIMLLVLDLWPESYFGNSSLRIDFIDQWIKKISKNIYKNCDSFLITSMYFKKPIISLTEKDSKFTFLPNWAEDVYYDFPKINFNQIPKFPDGFNILFAGNLGEAQGFEDVIAAAYMLKNEKINWIFVGDGRKKKWLKEQKRRKELDKVFIFDSYPLSFMPYIYKKSDCLMITLKNEKVFTNTLPGKFQGYLSAGKPILGSLSGEGKHFINNYYVGIASEAGNPKKLAENALKISNFSDVDKAEISKNCTDLNDAKFKKDIILNSLVTEIEKFNFKKVTLQNKPKLSTNESV